jgi:hypothetical protein
MASPATKRKPYPTGPETLKARDLAPALAEPKVAPEKIQLRIDKKTISGRME